MSFKRNLAISHSLDLNRRFFASQSGDNSNQSDNSNHASPSPSPPALTDDSSSHHSGDSDNDGPDELAARLTTGQLMEYHRRKEDEISQRYVQSARDLEQRNLTSEQYQAERSELSTQRDEALNSLGERWKAALEIRKEYYSSSESDGGNYTD